MNLLSVTINECSDYITNRLDKEIDFFQKEEIDIKKNITQYGKSTKIEFELDDKSLKNYSLEDFEVMFFHYMSNAFSDIIISEMEKKLVHKILLSDYYYFSPSERQIILQHLQNIQENEEFKYGEGVTYRISRKAKILQYIIDYLRASKEINLEGFIRFRLKNYTKELEEHIEKAVEDFLMEKEYHEFIRLLRYFVDIQEAKIDTVNVLIGEGGKYHLYDKLNRLINNEYLEDLAAEMADKDISYDDLLISSLITLAPKHIMIHFEGKAKNKEIMQTIKSVFSERVCICNGCKLCMQAQSVKE